MKNKMKVQQGFTLLEMLVVVSIIGLLTALLLSNFQTARARARDAARKSDLRQVKTALRLYYNDFQEYPVGSGGQIMGCGDGTATCNWGGSFEANGTVYMRSLPIDPVNNAPYEYQYSQTSGGDGFLLTTYLENKSDEDAEKSVERCGATADPEKYVVCED